MKRYNSIHEKEIDYVEYKKSDLIFDNYSQKTTPGDDPDIRGKKDSDLFNRHEDYEVLDMINNVSKYNKIQSKQILNDIEKYIHDDLDKNMRKKQDVLGHLIWKYKGK